MGHAKVLLSLVERDQIRAAEEAVRENLSVREVEKLVQNMLKKQPKRQSVTIDPNITSLQEELSNKLGVRVVFNHKKNGMGRMVIHYHSADELEGVLKTLHLKKVSTR